jgi:hypothetical protein
MELSIEFKKDEIKLIDDYNKNRILINILNRLVLKLKSNSHDESVINFFDQMNTLFLIENKFNLNNLEDESLKCQNNSNLYSPKNEVDLNTGKNFASLLFLNQEDFSEFVEKEKNKFLGNSDNFSFENLKLLSMFEEEIRNFLKKKKELLKKYKLKENSNILEKNSINIHNDNLTSKFEKIFTKFNENFELLNDIYENFKNSHIQREKREISNFENNLSSIKELLENLMNLIIQELTGEKSFLVMNVVKSKLIDENNFLTEDINKLKSDINEYTMKGEELTLLVKEYKKLSNLVDCKKNK